MKRIRIRHLLSAGVLMTFIASWANAVELETGWLKPEVGHKEEVMGATVNKVQDDTQTLTIAIPKKSAPNIKAIEEVIVVGKKPEKPDTPWHKKIDYEFIDAYDNDNYGLVIYLGKDYQIPFRLYFKAEELEQ